MQHRMADSELRCLAAIEHDALGGVLSYGNLKQALHAEGAAAAEASLDGSSGGPRHRRRRPPMCPTGTAAACG